MILDHVLHQLTVDECTRTWIDLCAAPGGKTGILAKHMGPGDVLIANEVVPQRRQILRENLIKGGFLNTFLTGESASSFHIPLADILLIDAPCAGEGMMRKDPEAIEQWHEGLVLACSRMQQDIVADAIHCLKPGGHLIYSTCSYSAEENLLNLDRFADRHGLQSVRIEFPESFQIKAIQSEKAVGYFLYPHRVQGEGLFIAVMSRPESEDMALVKGAKPRKSFQPLPPWLAIHMENPSSWLMRKDGDSAEFISADATELAEQVFQWNPKAELMSQAGELKGKDFIPSHFLVMSGLATGKFPVVDLHLDGALDYLERKTNLPPANAEGWHIVQYKGSQLGWAKNSSNGWKNHYPKSWHLRKRTP